MASIALQFFPDVCDEVFRAFFKKKELYQKPYYNHDAEMSSVYCCVNYGQMVYCHVRRRHSADDPPHRQSPRIYERT